MSIIMFVNPHLFKQKLFESHGFMARSLMDRIQKNPSKSFFYRLNPLKFHDIIIFDGFFHDIPWIFHQETIKKAMENPSLGVHLSPRPAAATEWWQFTFAQRGVRGAFAADARAPVGTM